MEQALAFRTVYLRHAPEDYYPRDVTPSEQHVPDYWEQYPLLARKVTTSDPIKRWQYVNHEEEG